MTLPTPAPRRESPRFALAVLGGAVLVALLYLRFHAAWRDELQAWALVRASPTLAALWQNLRPEGHPILWYLLIGAAQKITVSTTALAILHSALACCAIWILARHAPFSRAVRVLVALSPIVLVYFFAIARGYVLVEVLTFACCAELRGKRRPPALALLLALLAQTELQGAILGAGLWAAWALLERSRPPAERTPRARRELLVGLASYLASAAFCVLEMLRRARIPAAPPGLFRAVPKPHALAQISRDVLLVFVPAIEHRNLGDWLLAHPAIVVGALCALLALLTTLVARSPAGLVCWAIAGGGMLALGRFVALQQRHQSLLFIAFIAAAWLAAPALPSSPAPDSSGERRVDPRGLVLALLVAQLAPFGLLELWRDLTYPQSAAPEVVRYLQREGLTALPMICDQDFTGMSVVTPLDRACYLPSIRESTRFMPWGPRRREVGAAELQSATDLLLESAPQVLLVLNHPLWPPQPDATLLAAFTRASDASERFYLYRAARSF